MGVGGIGEGAFGSPILVYDNGERDPNLWGNALGTWLAPRVWVCWLVPGVQGSEQLPDGERLAYVWMRLSNGTKRLERTGGQSGRWATVDKTLRCDLSQWPFKSSVMSTKITKCLVQFYFLSKSVKGLRGCKRWSPGPSMQISPSPLQGPPDIRGPHETGWMINQFVSDLLLLFSFQRQEALTRDIFSVSLSKICKSLKYFSC